MIASWPGKIPAGSVSESICCLPDLTATFLNLAKSGAQIASGDGVDLMPIWTGKRSKNAHEKLVYAIGIKGGANTQPTPDNVELLAVRNGPWKLVRDQKRRVDALYNLADDLKESRDLSKENPQKKAELVEQATAYLKDCPPNCGPIANRDTRANGETIRNDALKDRCRKLLRQSAKSGAICHP
jgi:arylsulfatase A-like enzyme